MHICFIFAAFLSGTPLIFAMPSGVGVPPPTEIEKTLGYYLGPFKDIGDAYDKWLSFDLPHLPGPKSAFCSRSNTREGFIEGSTRECDPSKAQFCTGGMSLEEDHKDAGACPVPPGGWPTNKPLVAIPAALYDFTRFNGNSILCHQTVTIEYQGKTITDAMIFDKAGCGVSYPNGLDVNAVGWEILTGDKIQKHLHQKMRWKLNAPPRCLSQIGAQPCKL